ncbi:MAG: DUF4440 domain-containing protein [Usitatibacteraceae bacterium]
MPESTEALRHHLVDLELTFRRQQPGADQSEVAALLRDDFFEYGSSGGTIDKRMVLEYLGDDVVDMTSGDFKLDLLAEDVALLTYRSIKRFGSSAAPAYANRSSIWTRTDGKWQMFFHQGTPTKPFDFAA